MIQFWSKLQFTVMINRRTIKGLITCLFICCFLKMPGRYLEILQLIARCDKKSSLRKSFWMSLSKVVSKIVVVFSFIWGVCFLWQCFTAFLKVNSSKSDSVRIELQKMKCKYHYHLSKCLHRKMWERSRNEIWPAPSFFPIFSHNTIFTGVNANIFQ